MKKLLIGLEVRFFLDDEEKNFVRDESLSVSTEEGVLNFVYSLTIEEVFSSYTGDRHKHPIKSHSHRQIWKFPRTRNYT